MDESDIGSFFMWAAITGIIMLVAGISYRAYSKKNKGDYQLFTTDT